MSPSQAIRMVDDSLDGFGHITADRSVLSDEKIIFKLYEITHLYS